MPWKQKKKIYSKNCRDFEKNGDSIKIDSRRKSLWVSE